MDSLEQTEDKVQLLAYEPQYKADFKRLNAEWIEHYFRLEELTFAFSITPTTLSCSVGAILSWRPMPDRLWAPVSNLLTINNKNFGSAQASTVTRQRPENGRLTNILAREHPRQRPGQ